jgi:LysM repeat protein
MRPIQNLLSAAFVAALCAGTAVHAQEREELRPQELIRVLEKVRAQLGKEDLGPEQRQQLVEVLAKTSEKLERLIAEEGQRRERAGDAERRLRERERAIEQRQRELEARQRELEQRAMHGEREADQARQRAEAERRDAERMVAEARAQAERARAEAERAREQAQSAGTAAPEALRRLLADVPRSGPHTVAPGDSLERIARAHRVRVEALAEANPGVRWDRVRPGQLLEVPSAPASAPPAPPAPPAAPPVEHHVHNHVHHHYGEAAAPPAPPATPTSIIWPMAAPRPAQVKKQAGSDAQPKVISGVTFTPAPRVAARAAAPAAEAIEAMVEDLRRELRATRAMVEDLRAKLDAKDQANQAKGGIH